MKTKGHKLEIIEKIEKVRNFISQYGIDYMYIQQPYNFSWLTGGVKNYVTFNAVQTECGILIGKYDNFIITPPSEISRLKTEIPDNIFEFCVFDWQSSIKSTISEITGNAKVKNDKDVDISEFLFRNRIFLNENEQNRLKLLGRESSEALETILINSKPTDTELEITARLSSELIIRGLEPELIIITGEDKRLTHHHISGKSQVGNFFMGIICVKYKGLIVSLTRMRMFRKSKKYLELARKIRELETSVIDKSLNSDTIGKAFSFLIKEYEKRGYANKWKEIHQGGIAGYKIKEEFANINSKTVIKDNMAFAWNISLLGVKYEDTFLKKNEKMIWITRNNNTRSDIVKTTSGNVYHRPLIL